MANFDSLRPATLGALSYLSCETGGGGGGGGGQTVEVVGCWPFVENGLDIVGSANYTVNSTLYGDINDIYSRLYPPYPTVTLPQTYSFEVLIRMTDGGLNGYWLTVGNLTFYRTGRPSLKIQLTGSSQIEISTDTYAYQTNHFGVVKTAGKYKFYFNGVYKGEVNAPTTETQRINYSDQTTIGFRNARLCVGDITQNGVFPIRQDWLTPFNVENCYIIGGG